MKQKIFLLLSIFLFTVNYTMANEMTFECHCNINSMIQSIGRVKREYSSDVLRFKIKYDPRTNIGEVYYVTGEPHAVFKQCKLSDKDIIITYHDEDSKGKGSYRGQLRLNRYTGDILGEIDFQSYAKNGYGMDMWRFRDMYSGSCKPYTVTKKF